MRILLTGRTGQLGSALIPRLARIADLTVTGRSDLDLSNERAIHECVRRARPDIIVNAAAFTAVDLAETRIMDAEVVNTVAPRILAEEAHRAGAGIVHFSTDYVFDGRKSSPYTERDTTTPLNVYGRTKLDGETAVREACPAHMILRLSWVYDGTGSNFLTTMNRLLLERDQLSVVNDQFGSPTYAGSAAEAVAGLLGRAATAKYGPAAWLEEQGGTLHMTGPGSTSWYGFALEIRDSLSRAGHTTARLTPILTRDFPRPARRPANSRLSSNLLRDRLGVELPHWTRQFDECLAQAHSIVTDTRPMPKPPVSLRRTGPGSPQGLAMDRRQGPAAVPGSR